MAVRGAGRPSETQGSCLFPICCTKNPQDHSVGSLEYGQKSGNSQGIL